MSRPDPRRDDERPTAADHVRPRSPRHAARSGPPTPTEPDQTPRRRGIRRYAPALAIPLVLGLAATGAAPALVHVHRGDTLWGLAREYGTSVDAIKQANHLPDDVIYAGSTLKIPGKPAVRTYPRAVTSKAAEHRWIVQHRPAPTKKQVRTWIRVAAAVYGVDPALALAVAEQESGFQQDVVSEADAIGVMQVLPSTGEWISDAVVGRRLNLLDGHDNVIAGVALLAFLVRAAPLPNAVAGYYQGLASVRRNGMYADTRLYVRSVLRLAEGWR